MAQARQVKPGQVWTAKVSGKDTQVEIVRELPPERAGGRVRFEYRNLKTGRMSKGTAGKLKQLVRDLGEAPPQAVTPPERQTRGRPSAPETRPATSSRPRWEVVDGPTPYRNLVVNGAVIGRAYRAPNGGVFFNLAGDHGPPGHAQDYSEAKQFMLAGRATPMRTPAPMRPPVAPLQSLRAPVSPTDPRAVETAANAALVQLYPQSRERFTYHPVDDTYVLRSPSPSRGYTTMREFRTLDGILAWLQTPQARRHMEVEAMRYNPPAPRAMPPGWAPPGWAPRPHLAPRPYHPGGWY